MNFHSTYVYRRLPDSGIRYNSHMFDSTLSQTQFEPECVDLDYK